jgi:hypothetical protein
MDKYFAGETKVGPIEFTVGKDSVIYEAVERWVNTDRSHTVRCELSDAISFKWVVGTSLTEIERLKSTIESSVSNGMASLKSKIEAESGSEFTLTKSTEETHAFNFPAPHCGRQTYFLYQRVRDHLFVIKRQRWPRKLRKPLIIETPVREYTANFDVRIDSDRDDPACPCKDEGRSDLPGEILRFSIGKLSVVATANRERDHALSVMIGPSTYTFKKTDGSYYEATVKVSTLPDMMRTLSGVQKDEIKVKAIVEDESELETAAGYVVSQQ